MLNALIVDDDEMSIEVLKDGIRNGYKGGKATIFSCKNVSDARKLLKKEKIHVIFLDIEMPGENGFDLLSGLDELDFFIVFTTAHSQYAIKAIKTGAIDYLMKPIKADELTLVLKRIDELLRKRKGPGLAGQIKQSNEIAELYDLYSVNYKEKDSIIVPHQGGVKIFLFKDIIRIEGDGNYSKIYGKNSLLTSKTLKYFETKLSENSNFYRAHKSNIVNVKYIKELCRENFCNYAKMSDGTSVEISRRAYPGLLKKISSKGR